MTCPSCNGIGGTNIIIGMDEEGRPIFGAAHECPWCHGTGIITPAWERYIPKGKTNESN
jgi:DnaJ-class molecular chaperone